jgi:hypothetical protein
MACHCFRTLSFMGNFRLVNDFRPEDALADGPEMYYAH